MNVRCPHCHNAIEVLEESDLSEVLCPSCGSNFSLVSGETKTWIGDLPARKIAQFELTENLGTGAFGSVWKARDTPLDRTVAVKTPRPSPKSPIPRVQRIFLS